jgi:hypothetical protein
MLLSSGVHRSDTCPLDWAAESAIGRWRAREARHTTRLGKGQRSGANPNGSDGAAVLAIGLATASAAEMPMAAAAIDFLSVRMANIAFETSRIIVRCHVSGFPILLQIAFEDRTDSLSLLQAGRPRRGARVAVRKSFKR